jgi:hypothetical protein
LDRQSCRNARHGGPHRSSSPLDGAGRAWARRAWGDSDDVHQRRTFFSVFVWLKTLADIATMLPQWNPRQPPRWLARVMNRIGNQKGERFEDYWRRTRAEEDTQAASDERPI